MAEFDPDAFLTKREKRGGFDPDAFLAKRQPESAAQTFGRSAASLADSVLNTATGVIEAFNYPFNLAYRGVVQGKPLAQASAEAQQAVALPKDIVGRAFNVQDTRGFQNAPARQLGTAVGETVSENVIQPAAQAFNVPEEYVGNVLNSLAIGAGPVAGRATAATGRAIKATAQVPVDVAKGALGRATGYIAEPGVAPQGYQVPSSRIPLGDTFIPAKEMAELQRGMPISEGAVRPISELAPAPVLALSGGEIPVAGRAAQAYGERLGETYRNPLTAAADIGSMFLTGGVPVLTAGRGALGLAQAGADAYLARKGFTGLTPEQTTALNQGTNPFYTPGPVAPKAQPAAVAPAVTTQAVEPQPLPQLTYNPTQPVMYASETGVVGKNPQAVVEADLAQRYAPQPVAAVAQETPVIQPVKPLAVVEDVAKTPEQLAAEQKILDFINARRGATPEAEPQPVVEPKKRISQEQRIREREAMMTPEELAAQQAEVERNLAKSRGKPLTTTSATQQYASPSEMRKALIGTMSSDQLENLIKQTFPSADALKQKMAQPKTAEDAALSEALRQRLEALKSQGKYKPPGVMEMVSDDMAPRKIGKFDEVYPTKEAMDYETMFSTLGDKNPRVKRYQEGNTIVEITQINYGTAPKELLRQLNKPTTATRTYDAKTGKQLSGPPKD